MSHPQPTAGQIRRMARKTDRKLRAISGPRSTASERKKSLARVLASARVVLGVGYDQTSAESLWRETYWTGTFKQEEDAAE